jgi:hypothetical protein
MLGRSLPALLAGLAAALPGSAFAAAPANDNYLSSLRINAADGSLPPEFTDRVDTSEATTQADLFNPNRDGVPFGGAPAEQTSCPGAPAYGKTVWYDFAPAIAGGVEIVAAGFDGVVSVYEWDPRTSLIRDVVICQNASSAAAEEVLLQRQLVAGRSYTFQVGGLNGVGGPLDVRFRFFGDRDGDGILDEQPDKCPALAGISAFGGCPPVASGVPRLRYSVAGSQVTLTRLAVERLAKGGRVEVRCGGCGGRVSRTARRAGTLRITGFEGRLLSGGDRLEVRITQRKTRSGRYRHGAIGRRVTWRVTPSGLGRRTERCTMPGKTKRIRCP